MAAAVVTLVRSMFAPLLGRLQARAYSSHTAVCRNLNRRSGGTNTDTHTDIVLHLLLPLVHSWCPPAAHCNWNDTFGFRYRENTSAIPYAQLPQSARDCVASGMCYNNVTREKWWVAGLGVRPQCWERLSAYRACGRCNAFAAAPRGHNGRDWRTAAGAPGRVGEPATGSGHQHCRSRWAVWAKLLRFMTLGIGRIRWASGRVPGWLPSARPCNGSLLCQTRLVAP